MSEHAAITLEELPLALAYCGARRFRRAAEPARVRDDERRASASGLEAARVLGEERRRLERDLHDGAQQRLVSLSVQLSRLALRLDPGSAEAELLADAQSELRASLAELRDLAHGLHPSVLSDYGLEAALRATCTRAPLPVRLVFDAPAPLPGPVEVAAYYLVTEALTNVAKYAHAESASVFVTTADKTLIVAIADDGVGGACGGFTSARERLAILGGTLSVDSPLGVGTTLRAEIPL
jgi:signal transduction histidine kinase